MKNVNSRHETYVNMETLSFPIFTVFICANSVTYALEVDVALRFMMDRMLVVGEDMTL